jgi:hypothetical protein
VDLVTPIPASISRPLIEGLRNEIVCHDPTARRLFPFQPLTYAEAVNLALRRTTSGDVETIWSTALSSVRQRAEPVQLTDQQGMIIEKRQRLVHASAEQVYAAFAGIGGRRGWFTCDWAWRLRGMLDRLVGGVGMRRGRRHPDDLLPGEALDFWRVEVVEPGRRLRLRAEMRLPGRAWLQFEVEPVGPDATRLTQTAFFEPRGLGGLAYWYALYPLHKVIFNRLIRAVADRAERRPVSAEAAGSCPPLAVTPP